MRQIFFLLPLFFTLTAFAQTSAKQCKNWSVENLLYAAQSEAGRVLQAKYPKQKVRHAKQGLKWAEACVQSFPKELGCYYYRGLNQAFYLESTGLSYQKKLKLIIKDMEQVIRFNPHYLDGSAYQMLGNIYLKLPEFSLKKGGLLRDLDKAENYAVKAIEVSSADVDNRLLLAEVLVAKGKLAAAHDLLEKLLIDFPRKRPFTLKDRDRYQDIKKLHHKSYSPR